MTLVKKTHKQRALIATNHLDRLSGSEVVSFEIAQYLLNQGYSLTVYANFMGSPMSNLFRTKLGLAITTDPNRVKPFQFDFCYFQHQVAPLFSYHPTSEDRERTAIIFGRLSRRSFLESGGWTHDNALGDATIANSELTAEYLALTGVTHPVTTFYNAAPQPFFAAPRPLPERPRNILLVSNHRDIDLLGAIDLLRAESNVRHIGRSGSEYLPITPDLIQSTDLVVSIGKTIPYALVAHTPVYVYDHFGGPGYLTAANFDSAARFNFSGRCCERKLKAEDIRQEILTDYAQGVAFAKALSSEQLARYRFESYGDKLRAIIPRSTADKRKALQLDHGRAALERQMAAYTRVEYIKGRRLAS